MTEDDFACYHLYLPTLHSGEPPRVTAISSKAITLRCNVRTRPLLLAVCLSKNIQKNGFQSGSSAMYFAPDPHRLAPTGGSLWLNRMGYFFASTPCCIY